MNKVGLGGELGGGEVGGLGYLGGVVGGVEEEVAKDQSWPEEGRQAKLSD